MVILYVPTSMIRVRVRIRVLNVLISGWTLHVLIFFGGGFCFLIGPFMFGFLIAFFMF